MFVAAFDRGPASEPWSGVDDALSAAANTSPAALQTAHVDHAQVAAAMTATATDALYVSDDLLVAHWARIDNRSELTQRYGLHSTVSTAELLARAFEAEGGRCVERLRGAFSFVVFDRINRRVFAGRDQLGLRPFLFHLTDQQLIVTTSANVFRALPGCGDSPSQRWLARYIAGLSADDRTTPWTDVEQLAPAHQLTWNLDRPDRAVATRYHSFDPASPAVADDEPGWIAAYRSELERAVAERTTDSALGVETSGGVDSSTLLAIAADHRKGSVANIHAMGFATFEKEPEMLMLTSDRWGITNNHLLTSREVENATIDRALVGIGHPPEHAIVFGHLALYRLCEELGVRVLLSGFGGDEAVTNPADLAFAELLRRRPLRAPGVFAGNPAAALARAVRGERRRRMAPRMLASATLDRWALSCVKPEAAAAFDLAPADREPADTGADARRLNSWVIDGRLGQAFVAARTSQGAASAAAFGVDYRWPLLDVDLIARWLATPTALKARGGVGRYLHRRAVDDLVPEKVLWNPTKSMGALTHPLVDSAQAQAEAIGASAHPRLRELVDLARHAESAAVVEHNPAITDNRLFVHAQESRRLRFANRWLQDRYPV